MKARHIIITTALISTVWFAFFSSAPTEAVSEASPRTDKAKIKQPYNAKAHAARQEMAVRSVPLVPRPLLFKTNQATGKNTQLFSAHSWAPPAPVQIARADEQPAIPTWPYIYAGKKQEDGAWEIYLSLNGQMFIVHEGEILNNTYKIKTINPPSMVLMYLPLSIEQTVSIGAAL